MDPFSIISLVALGLKVVPPMIEAGARLLDGIQQRRDEGREMTQEERDEVVAFEQELARRAAATAPAGS